MTKPREFWIKEVNNLLRVTSIKPVAPQRQVIHVREVMPIDWEKVWKELSFKLSNQREIDIVHNEGKIILQELVDKSLKGELE